jgi:hypothetical protein
MKLIVGAPVADRDWALPRWFECLQNQTRPPDEYVFVVKEVEGGGTRRLLHELAPVKVPQLSYAIDTTPYIPRHERNFHEAEYVYGDFAARRNALLRMALKREPDVILSLDTDVMLEDPTAIERLLQLLTAQKKLTAGEPDLVAPCLFLHAAGRASECFNAAWWAAGEPGSPERAWRRATAEDAAAGVQLIDIPMAAVMMTARVAETCRYAYHRQGEDMGFAQDLDRQRYRCLWDPDLEVRHVMSETAL